MSGTRNERLSASKVKKHNKGLLALPPTIRQRIGHYVIENDTCSARNGEELVRVDSARSFKRLQGPIAQPAITRTCRLLRHELLSYFYEKKLHVLVGADDWHACGKWLNAIGPHNRQVLRGLYRDLVCNSDWPTKNQVIYLKTRAKRIWHLDIDLEHVAGMRYRIKAL